MDDGNPTRKDNGVEPVLVPMMTITVDPRTGLPSYKCTELPIGFWQMIVDEVARQLEEQRRAANAMLLQQRIAEANRDAAIAEAVKRGR